MLLPTGESYSFFLNVTGNRSAAGVGVSPALFSGVFWRNSASANKARLVNRPRCMFAQQLGKPSQAAFLIGAKVVVNVPAQIIIAEIVIIVSARPNDIIESVHSEIARFTQLAAQSGILHAAPQCPDSINKGQSRHFIPCRPEVPKVVLPR